MLIITIVRRAEKSNWFIAGVVASLPFQGGSLAGKSCIVVNINIVYYLIL